MKPKRFASRSAIVTSFVLTFSAASSTHAASDSWDGSTDSLWATATNWLTDVSPPGAGETATFNNAGNGNTTIDLGAGVTLGSLVFDTASAASHTIGVGAVGSQTLTLNTTGNAIAMTSAVVNNQTINSNLALTVTRTVATPGTYYVVTNDSLTNPLTIAGGISASTAGVKVLNVTGGGNTAVSGAITSGTGNMSLFKTGSGTLTLSGGGTFSGNGITDGAGFATSAVFREGTTILNGGTYSNSGGEPVIGGVAAHGGVGTNTTLQLDNATFNNISWLSVGRGNGNGTVTSNLTLNGSSSITSTNLSAGYNAGNAANISKGTITLNGTSILSVNDTVNFAESAGAIFTMNVNNTAIFRQTGNVNNTQTKVGINSGAVGVINVNGGTAEFHRDFILGAGGTGSGKLVLNSGTVNMATTLERWLKINDSGSASTGQIDVNGGNLNLNTNTDLRFSTNGGAVGTNVVNLNAGAIAGYTGNNNGVFSGSSVVDLNQGSTQAGVNNTFNLNGGTLTIGEVLSTRNEGTATFNFNGGTLKAAGTTANFVNLGGGSQTAIVKSGGAFIDSNGFAVTIPQALLDGGTSGGLTKTGTGTLTLSGGNTYTGATTVTAGTLTLGGSGSINASSGITINGSGAKLVQTSTAVSTTPVTLTQGTVDGTETLGAVTVGAGTGGVVANGNGTTNDLAMDSLTFNGAGTVNLNIPGGAMTNSPGLYVSSALTTSGGTDSVTVNIAPTSPLELGTTYDLMDIGSLSGSVNDFVYSGDTARVTGVFALNGNLVTLTLSGDAPKWTGLDSGEWKIGSTGGSSNWQLQTGGSPTNYITGDFVLFDDSAGGTTSITIPVASVSPGSTTFTNTTKDYTVSSGGGFGIAGSGPLVKNGTGKVTFSTDNTYTGTTTINEGTLQIGSGGTTGSLSPASALTNHGNLTFNRSDTVTQGTHFSAGAISGTGSVTQAGVGTLVLNAANSYEGATTISAGAVSFNGNNRLGADTAPVTLNGGTLQPNVTGGAITNTHVITVGASGGTINVVNTAAGTPTFVMGAAGNLTGSGALTVTGGGPLVFGNGADVLVLNSANAGYTGAVGITDGGIIEYSNNDGVGAGATFAVGNNGTLSASNATIASGVTVSSGGYLAFQNTNTGGFSGAITLNADATIRMQDWWGAGVRDGAITGDISGAGGLVLNSGSGAGGTLTLSGTNTYGGNTTVTASALKVVSPASLPGYATPGKISIDSTSTLAVNAGGVGEFTTTDLDSIPTNVSFAPGGILGVDTTNAGGSLNYSTNITGDIGLAKYGTGTLALTGANTYTGATRALGGILEFQGAGTMSASSALSFGNGGGISLRADADTTFTPVSVTGSAGNNTVAVNQLTGAGAGKTLTLANSYTAGASGSSLTVSSTSGDTLLLSSQLNMFNASAPNTTINLSGANMTLNAGVNFNGATNGPLLIVNANSNTLLINGTYTTGGNRWAGIRLENGTLTLANGQAGGSSTNNGLYAVLNGGTLNLNNNNAIGGAVAGNNFTINGGTLDNTSGSAKTLTRNPVTTINGNFAFSTAGGTSANDLNIGTNAVSLGTAAGTTRTITTDGSATLTVGGAIGNGTTANSLTKAGTGTLLLKGANTYTGATTVSAGTLALENGSQASPITVDNGASLGFTLGAGTTSTSTVTFGATSTVKITGTPTLPSYTLITASSISGTPVLDAPIPGYSLTVTDGNTLVLAQAAGYGTWADANAGGQDPDGDFDLDGVDNGTEYFMGQTGSTFTANPGVVNGKVTWPKDPAFSGSYTVQTSSNLVTWTNVASNEVGNTVEYTLPTGMGKLFVRLVVTPN